jgi:hypothetical protein
MSVLLGFGLLGIGFSIGIWLSHELHTAPLEPESHEFCEAKEAALRAKIKALEAQIGDMYGA